MKLGCFKIETGENIVTVFIGLRAKMHCYTIEHQDKNLAKTKLKKKKSRSWTCNEHDMEESFR